uniref:Uncharacterized protein n=1 Tax=Thermofilum adornatum TaxID=1365176 RepID=A0A7C1CG17_9CREN
MTTVYFILPFVGNPGRLLRGILASITPCVWLMASWPVNVGFHAWLKTKGWVSLFPIFIPITTSHFQGRFVSDMSGSHSLKPSEGLSGV